ncbi:MAG: hypothetical protein NTV06_01915, partial [candidate division Zixibacteria bacterium]|nr:hypothetical protein [candidate division Zixibacteria bacterium]
QVLDFSRASRTKTREIDFNLLVAKTSDLLLTKIRHRRQPPLLNLADQKLCIWGNPDQLQHALLQFMIVTMEDMTDECSIELATRRVEQNIRLTIGFNGQEEVRARVDKTLRQIFGNPTGTQRLSIIVAGETIRYHGGDYGVESFQENLPKLYIELPHFKGVENASASNS